MRQILFLRSALSCNPRQTRLITLSITSIAIIFCFSDRGLPAAQVEHVGLAALLLAKPLPLSHPWVETLPWVVLVIIITTFITFPTFTLGHLGNNHHYLHHSHQSPFSSSKLLLAKPVTIAMHWVDNKHHVRRCSPSQPHSLWHAQSAAGLLDFFLLIDNLVATIY